ncbi:hypothetical protein WJX84_012149 [Apatococcus fuscideae]|uniref:Uncharacterized protein n=1 Tax=Apatococcus fuscideae TaxID=2026836 RepID=A0AAW1STY3_9CHLO
MPEHGRPFWPPNIAKLVLWTRARGGFQYRREEHELEPFLRHRHRALWDWPFCFAATLQQAVHSEALMGPVSVSVQPGGFAHVQLCSEPVNVMDMAMWQGLMDALEECEASPAVRGIIFSSGVKRDVFTAGNSLKELHAPSTTGEKYINFWHLSQDFLLRLYKSPLFTICAIRGACPAGGCILSLLCDGRIMTEAGTIGLNEVALGIPVPYYWVQVMCQLIGQGQAYRMLMGARLATLKYPDGGRTATKAALRQDLASGWGQPGFVHKEATSSWDNLSKPETVAFLGGIMKSLEKKGKAERAKL